MSTPELLDAATDGDATHLPDASAPWVRRLMALTPNDVLREAKDTWPQLKLTAWRFAFLVYRIQREGLFRPYESLTAWARAELGRDSAVVAKYRQSAEFVLELEDEDERAAAMATPPATLAEAGVHRLAKVDRPEAVRLAQAGMTQRDLRDAVNERLAEREHRDVGGVRNLHFSAITVQSHRAFMRAYRQARFLCQTPKPPDSELLELIAQELGSSLQIQPETLQWMGRVAFSLRFVLDEEADYGIRQQLDAELGELPEDAEREELGLRFIAAGYARCIECGASNGNGLEGNHSVPKSKQGHSSPMVPMCGADHREFTENIEAHWKVQNRLWMNRADLGWFKAAMEAWLNGRRLEEL
ncbi:MAG: hypothetical protein SF182_01515 [Deltaproteobacteria bacterium]|nr:hypothetical protein [Deltaproteobacteria bacterium]